MRERSVLVSCPSFTSCRPFGTTIQAILVATALMLPASGAQTLGAQLVASGFSAPLLLTAPPGDPDRLFIVEQNGLIKIRKAGVTLPTPFIDLTSVSACCGERGVLGLAFHPDYAVNGKFYVSFTDNSGNSVVRQYNVSMGNPDVADPATFATIYGPVSQPFSNHNGGGIAFSPVDGMLYYGLGDGGSAGDPGNRAQNLSVPLGKMLRFDVDIAPPYIPASNPFVGVAGALPEIWAYGLRNPWRWSFDRQTGDLYIGDVGQNAWEEIDFQPSTSMGGENYGWRCMEGDSCYGAGGCTCFDPALTDPIHDYAQAGNGCSVTGGYVYRGTEICGLQGTYIFGDYCSGRVWSFRYDGMTLTEFTDRTAQLAIPGTESPTSFGEDGLGEIYMVDATGGEIWKIVGSGGMAGLCGDCDSTGTVDVLDAFEAARIAVALIPASPSQSCVCDTNADRSIDVLDAFAIAQDSVGIPVTLTCP